MQGRSGVHLNPVGGVILRALVVQSVWRFKVYQRYTLKMPLWEAIRLALGLAIPVFLLSHIANTRFAHEVFGVDDTYIYEFVKLWPNVGVDPVAARLGESYEALAECRRGSHHPVAARLGAFVYRPSLLAPYEDVVPPDPESLVHACDPDTDFVAPRILRSPEADAAWLAALKAETNWPDAVEATVIADVKKLGLATRRGFIRLA